MDRRSFIKTAGAGSVIVLAGCAATPTDDGGTTRAPRATIEGTPSGTLTVATYSSFTGEGTAGNYLKSAFESAYPSVTVEFTVPNSGVNKYIQAKQSNSPIDADLYVGLNTDDLVRADRKLDTSLFMHSREYLDRKDAIKSDLEIDPRGRAIPYDTGYISLVYDESEVTQPQTFDDLLDSEYEGDLLAQDARFSDPGLAFLLWTIDAKGEDGYLDYWSALADNNVRIFDDWEPAYNAYSNEEAPIVVSYSTDQVYAHRFGSDMARHQVGFLNDQGYENPETMARFSDTNSPALARLFMDFALQPEQQEEIAKLNVQFPAVTDAALSDELAQYAYEPPESVTFTYDDLEGSVDTWTEDWAREVVGN